MNGATHSLKDGWHPYAQLSLPYLAAHQQLLELTAPELIQTVNAQSPKLESLQIEYKDNAPLQACFDKSGVIPLHPDADFIHQFQLKIEELNKASPPLIVVAGLGSYLEFQLLEQFAQQHPQRTILLIDHNPQTVFLNLALYDMRSLLLSGAWVWAAGEPLAEILLEQVKAHSLFMAFTNNMDMTFGSNARDAAAAQEYVDIFQSCVERLVGHCQSLNQESKIFLARLNQKPDSTLKVWSAGSVSEYTSTPILRALHRGLNSAGVKSEFTALPRGRTRKFVEYEGLVRAQADIVLSLNDPSHSVVPQGGFHRAVWVTDDPTMRKNLEAFPTYNENEVVLYADEAYLPALQRQGAKRTAHLPVFALLEHEGKRDDAFAFPITFVGMIWNLNPFLEKIAAKDRNLLREAHQVALDSGAGTLGLRNWWAQRDIPASLLKSAQRYFQVSGRVFHEDEGALTYLTYMLDMDWRRRRMAEALLPLGLHVFGNRDWLPILGEPYADRYHGFVPYDRLGDVYRSTKVVVGIHSLQLPSSINIRDCDVLRAGGCLLTDSVSGMREDTIQPGRDCAAASSPEEFAEAAQNLLNDEARRDQLRLQGMKTIESGFLPEHRAEIIIETLKQ